MSDSLSETMKRVEALLANQEMSQVDESASLQPSSALMACVEDQARTSSERIAALRILSERLQGESELSDLILGLMGDPEPSIVTEAFLAAPPFDVRVNQRMRSLLDDPRTSIWQAAAQSLARKKDRAILPLMMIWARDGDVLHRRTGLAAVAFLLIPEEHLEVVEAICEEGARDDEDEAILVEALKVAEARVQFWRKATGTEDD